MRKLIAATTLAAVLAGVSGVPTTAEARTKDIVKYGAIGLGAAVVGSALSNSYGNSYGYSNYGGYYNQGYYPSSSYYYPQQSYYYSQPYYSNYSYSYSQPYYGGGYYYY